MPKTQVNCPSCRQPVVVEVQQMFDVTEDPLAKQKLLSNAVNFLHCPNCGYQGMLGVPLVYHDPKNELLLTFFPPDLNKTINEQEKQIGPMINRIIDRLPQEQRKAYLLQPQSMLTYQTLIEKILESEGITKEMLEEQQKKVKLLEKLLTTTKDDRLKVIKEEESQIDAAFFSILNRIMQSAIPQGDEASKNELIELQQLLYENTELGKQLLQQRQETENALKSLQAAGKEGLTREKLLDVILNAKTDTEIATIVSLTHGGIDYTFYQLLSDKIEAAKNVEEKKRLTGLREKLLELTEEINNQLKLEAEKTKAALEKILQSENIEEATMQNVKIINEFFVHNLEAEISQARKKGDLERINKLEQVMVVIEKLSTPAEEVQLLESFIETKDEAELDQKIEENKDGLSEEFMNLLNNVIAQYESSSENPK
ncbi:MAG: hypothetical protein FJZ98_01880, partial [Chloroflexi bacterium]|nr:hypothetical protein [Chloroflexota bacterium]